MALRSDNHGRLVLFEQGFPIPTTVAMQNHCSLAIKALGDVTRFGVYMGQHLDALQLRKEAKSKTLLCSRSVSRWRGSVRIQRTSSRNEEVRVFRSLGPFYELHELRLSVIGLVNG